MFRLYCGSLCLAALTLPYLTLSCLPWRRHPCCEILHAVLLDHAIAGLTPSLAYGSTLHMHLWKNTCSSGSFFSNTVLHCIV
jgi:hypothetical protein